MEGGKLRNRGKRKERTERKTNNQLEKDEK